MFTGIYGFIFCDPKVINSSLTAHLKVVDGSIDYGCIPPLSVLSGNGSPNARYYLRGDNTWQPLNRLFVNDNNGDMAFRLTLQADGNLVLHDIRDGASTVVWHSNRYPAANGNTNYFLNGNCQWSQIPTFVGATTTSVGVKGLVPGSTTQARLAYLRGDGTWNFPTGTTYAAATTATAGLMSAADKIKVNKTTLVSQLGADSISKNGTYLSAVSAATIQVYRIAGDSGILCFTANGINVTAAAGNGAHLFSLSLTNGGGKVAGDWYFKPMSSAGTFKNTGAFVASAGSSTTTVLKVYAYGTIDVGTYSVSTVIPVYFN